MSSFKFLGIHVSEDLKWTVNTAALVKRAQQRLYFLRTLRKAHLSARLLKSFYHCTVESILTYCITVWYGNCTMAERAALQRAIKTSQKIIGLPLPPLRTSTGTITCTIIKGSTHPFHNRFALLPSGRCYRALKTRTSRFRNSFYPTLKGWTVPYYCNEMHKSI